MALVKLPDRMVTLDELCADMAASGRSITPRKARDWWTKGLLPRPKRRGLGRRKGTETFWTDPRITAQAKAAYDLLSDHSRVKTALLNLWLLGFHIELRAVRKLYGELIERNRGWICRPDELGSDNVISCLAARAGRELAKSNGAPPEARNAMTDLTLPALAAFCGVDEENAGHGLAELWKTAAPCLAGKPLRPYGLVSLQPTDDDLEKWLQSLRERVSLTEQREALLSSTDYEMMRARRLLHFVFGQLRGIALSSNHAEYVEKLGRSMLIVLGRPAVPILIKILRDTSVRHWVVSSLLAFARRRRTL